MRIIISIIRTLFENDRTLGHIYLDNKAFCWTLEDTVRMDKLKIKKTTAIPCGKYKLIITFSKRFKREMVELLNVPNFSGIRIHGGNKPEDTEGCILVAFNKGKDNFLKNIIFTTAEQKVFNYVKKHILKGNEVWLEIINNRDLKNVSTLSR